MKRYKSLYKTTKNLGILSFAFFVITVLLIVLSFFLVEKDELRRAALHDLRFIRVTDYASFIELINDQMHKGYVVRADYIKNGRIIYTVGKNDRFSSSMLIRVDKDTAMRYWVDIVKLLGEIKSFLFAIIGVFAVYFIIVNVMFFGFIGAIRKYIIAVVAQIKEMKRKGHILSAVNVPTHFIEFQVIFDAFNDVVRSFNKFRENLEELVAAKTKEYKALAEQQKQIYLDAREIIAQTSMEDVLEFIYQKLRKPLAIQDYAVYRYMPESGAYGRVRGSEDTPDFLPQNDVKNIIRTEQVTALLKLKGFSGGKWRTLVFNSSLLMVRSETDPDKTEIKSYIDILREVANIVIRRLYLIDYWKTINAEMRKTIEEKNKYQKKLKDMKNFQDTYFMRIIHDIKNDLSPLLGYSELMMMGQMGPLSDGIKDAAKEMHSATERIISLTLELLDVTKLKSGAASFNFKKENVKEFIDALLQSNKITADKKGLEFVVEADDFEAVFDADKIRRVYENLINNAVKFTDAGSIRVFAKKKTDYDGRLCFYGGVQDTGKGMDKEGTANVFNEYFQTEDHAAGGVGLGLAIFKEIIDKHNGKYGVDSKLGKGSLFYFYIPIEEKQYDKQIGAGHKVVIITADTNHRNVLCAILQGHSFETECPELKDIDAFDWQVASADSVIVDLNIEVSRKMPEIKEGIKAYAKTENILVIAGKGGIENPDELCEYCRDVKIIERDTGSLEKIVDFLIPEERGWRTKNGEWKMENEE